MPREIEIDGVRIADDEPCCLIAEIGHNHQRRVDQCKDLFRVAKLCGANAVKLQKRNNRALFTRELYDKPYESENAIGTTYGAHREALEFDKLLGKVVRRRIRADGKIAFADARERD